MLLDYITEPFDTTVTRIKHKGGINFTPGATNLTEAEVPQPPNQCGLLSQDFALVPGVTADNQLIDKAISHNVNTAWATQRRVEAPAYGAQGSVPSSNADTLPPV